MFKTDQLNKALTICVCLILCASVRIWAQEEAVSYSTAAEKEENPGDYKYFNIDEYEQNLLFKINLVGAENLLTENRTGVLISSFGLEYKYRPAVSFDVEGMFSGVLNANQSGNLGAGVRYYPSKRINSKAKYNRVNNFSGGYLRLGYSGQFDDFKNEYRIPTGWDFSYGRQQKVGKWGYLDIAAVLTRENHFGNITLNTKISGGLAYARSQKAEGVVIDQEKTENYIWSGPIFYLNNPNIRLSDSYEWVFIALASEIHLKDYWTVTPEINFGYFDYKRVLGSVAGDGRPIDITYNLSVEFRKYLGVRKRIEKGVDVSSFSGYYVSMSLENAYLRANFFRTEGFNRPNLNDFYFAPHIGLGWQERVGNRFLLNISTGVGYNIFTEKVINFSNIGVGILLNK